MKVVASGDTLLAFGIYTSLSTDRGKTWTNLGYDERMRKISAYPAIVTNPNTFYKAGAFGIHRTTDAGQSWHLFMHGMTGTRIEDLIAFNDRLYAYTAYEVYQSTDKGESWKKVPIHGENNSGIEPCYHSKLVVVDNILYFFTTGDRNLRISRLSADRNMLIPVQDIPVFDKQADGPNPIYKSIVPKPYFERDPHVKTTAVSNNVFYVEYERRLFRWKFGAPEWTATGFIDTSRLYGDDYRYGFKLAVSKQTVYVGRRDGKLFQSLDGGSNWKDITPTLPHRFTRFNEIVFLGSTVYVATDEGVLTSHTGEHWRILTDETETPPIIDRFALRDSKIYGIGDTGVYHLETHRQWKKISSEVLDNINALAIMNDRLYSAVDEQGIFYISFQEE